MPKSRKPSSPGKKNAKKFIPRRRFRSYIPESVETEMPGYDDTYTGVGTRPGTVREERARITQAFKEMGMAIEN